MKVLESARGAVANGQADEEESRIATSRVEVSAKGALVPTTGQEPEDAVPVNGSHSPQQSNGKRQRDGDEDGTPPPRARMDISLHNFGDYSHETHG